MSAPTATVLERILAQTREEVARRKRECPLPQPAPADPGRSRPFREALSRPGIGVIAEFKRRSPSAGALSERPDLAATLASYERGGAVAASILTEGPSFHGTLEDLRAARAACGLALLRKDFVVDPYQLHESVHAGADAVLLIVAALTQPELESLYGHSARLGLDVLVEVHDRAELERALGLGAEIIGVNNRDLRDFSVDVTRTAALMGHMPAGTIVVSESGIVSAEQLLELRSAGVQAVLVGEALMRAPDPEQALRGLLGGR